MKAGLSVLLLFILFANISTAQTTDDKPVQLIEIEASFPGGMQAFYQFLGARLMYPQKAIKERVGGKVYVSFTVEPDGSLSNIKAIRSPSDYLSAEAIRVFGLSPHWRPAVQNGRAISRSLTMAVNFDLSQVTDTAAVATSKINAPDDTKKIYHIVDSPPKFPGGFVELQTFLSKHLIYPEAAKAAGQAGSVVVDFVVEKDGSLTNIKIRRGITPLLDNEALRVVASFPNWKPGMLRGSSVSVPYTLAIRFPFN